MMLHDCLMVSLVSAICIMCGMIVVVDECFHCLHGFALLVGCCVGLCCGCCCCCDFCFYVIVVLS